MTRKSPFMNQATEVTPLGAWRDQGRCAETDPGLFFPKTGDTGTVTAAKSICARCEVRPKCLDWALSQTARIEGVWGGASERERLVLKRKRKQAA